MPAADSNDFEVLAQVMSAASRIRNSSTAKDWEILKN